jgi:alkyl sulfatase BDS1-like metallo-beta-lactamase superfamily hydrolase
MESSNKDFAMNNDDESQILKQAVDFLQTGELNLAQNLLKKLIAANSKNHQAFKFVGLSLLSE